MATNHYDYFEELQLLEEVGRTHEIIEFIASAAANRLLNIREIRSLDVAYRKIIKALRASIRIIALAQRETKYKSTKMVTSYKAQLELEYKFYCIFIIRTIEANSKKFPQTDYHRVIYYKLVGDYYRHLSESDSEFHKATQAANLSYEKATSYAYSYLHPSHPTRLALAMNYSLLYDDLQQPDIAYEKTRKAYDLGSMEFRILVADHDYRELIENCLEIMEGNLRIFYEKKCRVNQPKWFLIFILWVAYAIMKFL